METQIQFGRRSKDRHGAGATPFRYPGGKAFLADVLDQRLGSVGGLKTYAEPFAGGAGAAIELLARGAVERLVLNDFDRRIFSAWHSILFRTDEFIDRIRSTKVTIDLWHRLHQIVEENASDGDRFELGFATFFLNRTNRSGVIMGAGPIGGYEQKGKWAIDARWYPETMIKRIHWLGDRRDNISLHNKDGLSFLKSYPAKNSSSTFFFIDPPYVQAGAKLYLNAMSDLKHRDLANYLTSNQKIKNWLVTYDDSPLVLDAYKTATIKRFPVRYSLHKKRMEEEVLFVPA